MAKQKWSIVTGASSGIGKEFAILLAKHQVNLVLTARNALSLNQLATQLMNDYQIKVLIYPTDLSVYDNVVSFTQFVNDSKVNPDYLINNAGFGDFGYFTDTKWEKESDMIDLNIKTLTYLTKIYSIQMKRRGSGKILNVASGAAFQPGPLMAVYFATKAYVLHFSEAIAEELSGTGVTVTTLCPGPTESNFWKAAGKKSAISIVPGKMPSSRVVAEYGYDAMIGGRRIAIQGFRNRVLAFLIRFVPRACVTKIIKHSQDR